jgi:lysophospholipase L1-like esterase
LLTLVLGLAAVGAVEGWFRVVEPTDAQLGYYVACEMNLARWSFLAGRRADLVLEPDVAHLATNQDLQKLPEPGRPAFDRIGVAYRVRTNGLGFREREFPPPDPGRPRVLVLGDSITFGKGVEEAERMTNVLQRVLPDRVVLNLGVEGCTTRCMADLLERHLGPSTALVVAQASMNDLDLTLWREADQARLEGLGLLALRLVSASRALMALTFGLLGDPQERQWAQAEAGAEAWYGAHAERLFARAAAQGVPVVVLVYPYATGRRPRHPLVTACRAHPETCLGVVEVALAPRAAAAAGPLAAWVVASADELGFRPESLARLFPLADHFHDVVHVAAPGQQAAADQLAAFLATRH